MLAHSEACPQSIHCAPPVEIVAAPATVFAVIDDTVSAVIEHLHWLDEQDVPAEQDAANFRAYARWRLALVQDAALLVEALLAGEDLAQSAWRRTQGRA
jgi:hypothetical protein